MELKTAIEILEYHQEWRLGKREDMIHEPKKLTEALDIVLREVKKNLVVKPDVSGTVCPNCEGTGAFAKDQNSEIICIMCNGTGQTLR